MWVSLFSRRLQISFFCASLFHFSVSFSNQTYISSSKKLVSNCNCTSSIHNTSMYQLPLTTPNGVCFLIQVSVSSSSIVTQKAAKATLSPACLIYPIPNLLAMTLRLKIYCTVKQLGMLLLYMPPRQLGKLVSSQMKRSPSSSLFFFFFFFGVGGVVFVITFPYSSP